MLVTAVPAMTAAILAALAACSPAAPAGAGGVRVVSLHDVTTELVVALGAVDRLVGVAEPVDVEPGVAAAIARAPRVGDLESILAVHPTLVVGLAVVAAQDPELVARLGAAGVAVYLPEPTTLDDTAAITRALAARVGADAAGERIAAQLAAPAAPPPAGRPVRVFVYDCCDPPFTAGGKAVLSDLIARAGGRNVFADLATAWTHVSWEDVVARRPELIVIDAYHLTGQGEVADKQRAVQAISALAGLPTAVVPLGCALGGLRGVEGVARLRAAIGAGK